MAVAPGVSISGPGVLKGTPVGSGRNSEGVAVGVGVSVGIRVSVGVGGGGVADGVNEGDGVGVVTVEVKRTDVAVLEGVAVVVGVPLTVGVAVSVGAGRSVALGLATLKGDGVDGEQATMTKAVRTNTRWIAGFIVAAVPLQDRRGTAL
jgi:hypothetical protein